MCQAKVYCVQQKYCIDGILLKRNTEQNWKRYCLGFVKLAEFVKNIIKEKNSNILDIQFEYISISFYKALLLTRLTWYKNAFDNPALNLQCSLKLPVQIFNPIW